MTNCRLPTTRFTNYQALSHPLQLAFLFLPWYLKQVPGFLWVFLNIPATSLSPLKFKSHSCCFLIAFPESGFKQGMPGMWLSL